MFTWLVDEAIHWLERGYEMHDPDMPYAFGPIESWTLISNPGDQALARKINLPLPTLSGVDVLNKK